MYKDVVEIMLEGAIKDINLDSMIQKIEYYKDTDFWESKNKRIEAIIDSYEVAKLITMYTFGFVHQIQELVGKLAPMLSKDCSYQEKIRNASDLIEVCEGHVYDVYIDEHICIKSIYSHSPEIYEYLALRKFNAPMLVPPKHWESNEDGGYYDTHTHCVIGSIHNRHNKTQSLDVLNLLQDIQWELDEGTLEYPEEPNKEFKNPDSCEQFTKFKEDSKGLYEKYRGKTFYFLWQMDKRGRQYSKGYHINLQASSYKKSLLNFARKELITGV